MKPERGFLWLLAPALALGSGLAAAEPGYAVREAELKASPDAAATTVVVIPADAAVDIGERKGGWLKVAHAKNSGWVRMTHIRFGSEAQRGSGTGYSLIPSARRSGSANAGAAKGLDGKTLDSAQPDMKQLEAMEKIATSQAQIDKFTRAVPLKPAQVDYPAKPAASSNNAFEELKI